MVLANLSINGQRWNRFESNFQQSFDHFFQIIWYGIQASKDSLNLRRIWLSQINAEIIIYDLSCAWDKLPLFSSNEHTIDSTVSHAFASFTPSYWLVCMTFGFNVLQIRSVWSRQGFNSYFRKCYCRIRSRLLAQADVYITHLNENADHVVSGCIFVLPSHWILWWIACQN